MVGLEFDSVSKLRTPITSLLFLSTLSLKGVILKGNNIYMIPVLWLHLLLDNLKYFNILLERGHSSAHPSGFLS